MAYKVLLRPEQSPYNMDVSCFVITVINQINDKALRNFAARRCAHALWKGHS